VSHGVFLSKLRRNDAMMLDRFAYVVIILTLTIGTIVGLAQAISFEVAMSVLGAAFVVSLALIWLGAKKKSR